MELASRYLMHVNPADLEYFHINKLPITTSVSLLPGFLIGGRLGKRLHLGEFANKAVDRVIAGVDKFLSV